MKCIGVGAAKVLLVNDFTIVGDDNRLDVADFPIASHLRELAQVRSANRDAGCQNQQTCDDLHFHRNRGQSNYSDSFTEHG